MKKPLCVFTVGSDTTNEQYAHKMLNSLYKTNPDIASKADVKFFKAGEMIQAGFTLLPNDLKMRYPTPILMKLLLQEYECVVRLDADMIITGDISSCWEGDFDVAVVQNGNPRELAAQQAMMGRTVQVWDLNPLDYVNCGFVVVKNEAFVDNWLRLCTPDRANAYQFYEQDFLNILVHYGNWKVKFLDRGDSFWGLASKGYWPQIIFDTKDGFGTPPNVNSRESKTLILPKNSGDDREPWPTDCDKIIKCLHWAGGGGAPKFHDIDIRFDAEVAKYLKDLITDEKKD